MALNREGADPAGLQKLYQNRFAGASSYRGQVWQVLVDDFFQRHISSTSTVLDLGAGYCEFINRVSASKKFAMDLNPDVKTLANADVEVLLHDCSTPWPVAPGSVDVIFTSNFLEHLLDKPAVLRTLAEAHAALKPGGLILCLGPNVRYVAGLYWDFFDHYVPLTDRSLGEALVTSNFSVEESIDRFLPFTMSDGKPKPVAFLKAYLRLRPAWKVFGKQFFVVGRKPYAS